MGHEKQISRKWCKSSEVIDRVWEDREVEIQRRQTLEKIQNMDRKQKTIFMTAWENWPQRREKQTRQRKDWNSRNCVVNNGVEIIQIKCLEGLQCFYNVFRDFHKQYQGIIWEIVINK